MSSHAYIAHSSRGRYTAAALSQEPEHTAAAAVAANNLGSMFAAGMGCHRDMEQAVNWWQKASELGHVEAMINLGVAAQQRGMVEEAMHWFYTAHARGAPAADERIKALKRMMKRTKAKTKTKAEAEWEAKREAVKAAVAKAKAEAEAKAERGGGGGDGGNQTETCKGDLAQT